MGSKTIKPKDNAANQQNANKGTKGQNTAHAKTQGNRGKQLNPNQQNRQKGESK